MAWYASPAWACPASCFRPPLRTFADGVSVPGNFVYFKVLADNPGELSLKTADGREIPASIRMIGQDRVYAPNEPIPADTLVVLSQPSNTCDRDAPKSISRFQTRAALDIQLQTAHLTAGQYGLISPALGEFYPPYAGPIAFQRLSYGFLDAAGAALHLIDVDMSVDGQRLPPGLVGQWSALAEIRGVCKNPVPRQVGTCPNVFFGPGRHLITVQPHIVGQPDPPPAELEIDFDLACGLGQLDASPAACPDGGTQDVASAASSPDQAPADASTSIADASTSIHAPSAPSAASGCAATGGSANGAAFWLALLTAIGSRRRKVAR
ncbi:MAG TPA: hypothetical protein VJV78_31800 [Polyangiales bacterium]|nr:hypothetical protein [Polyangiales bacterium]